MQNLLQLIMGYDELARVEFVHGNQELGLDFLDKSKKAVRELSTLVNENVTQKKREV